MARIRLSLILCFFGLSTFAFEHSAVRLDGENAEQAYVRDAVFTNARFLSSQSSDSRPKRIYVRSVHKKFHLWDKSIVAKASSLEQIEDYFEFVRDERFLTQNDGDDFLRRISWLYPDDGCFARAQMMVKLSDRDRLPKPSKIFVFGELKVRAKAPARTISWWYHVAPVFNLNGELYVIDPALDIDEPLPVKEWMASMTKTPEALDVSLCDSYAYTAHGTCYGGNPIYDIALGAQRRYLKKEWDAQLQLGNDPVLTLGERAPWQR